ncbi:MULTISPECIES: hypothetical protein [unclassified Candidatus Tisiphia]|uniref:hypothetical protein n=1 Tax=unclassified Candidatus Tisiphia TaxID=2996318 RepID=UPI00312C847C
MDVQNINICDENIRFEFTISIPPLDMLGFKGYVEKFECQALYSIYDDGNDKPYEKVIGKLNGYRFSLHSCYWDYDENNEDALLPLDILDMMDDNVAKLLCLFDNNCDVKAKYQRKLESILETDDLPGLPNIVLINRVEVLAEYRGRKFGETLISNSLYTTGKKNDLVIVDYMPLQLACKETGEPKNEWDEEMRFDELEQDEETARNKLKKYYKKLGFKLLNKEGLLFLII